MSRDRDRILEQALKHELRAADMTATDACLNAETLGAWADDGLDAAAMVAAEAHVAGCARCQALVGVMMKSAPGTESPSTVRTQSTVRTAGTLVWWKWLAPIAAGVTAATLWMVVPEQQQVAVAPPQPAADKAKENTAAVDQAPQPSAALPAAPARERTEARDNLAAASRDDRPQLREEAPKQEAESKLADANVARRESALPPAAAAPAAPAEAPIAALQKSAGNRFAPIEIVSPDPARRWRVVGGAIERSEDAGASWTPIRATSGETITAGSAPSGSICWLIGTNGLVLIAVDGVTFARVPLAEAIDLTSITAVDARNATVTTVDGRRFRTDDSGRTWRPF